MQALKLILALLLIAIATTAAYHFVNRQLVLYSQGQKYYRNHQYAEASEIYEQLAQQGFTASRFPIDRIRSYLAQKRSSEADKVARQLLLATTNNPKILVQVGDVYMIGGSFPQAINLYQSALKEDPTNKIIRLKLARTLSWNRNFNQSIEQYYLLLEEKQ